MGAGSVFGSEGAFTLNYAPLFSDRSDRISPDASSETAFSGSGGSAAVDKDSLKYRTIYFGFPFGALATAGERQQVISKVLEFCDTTCAWDYNLDLNNQTIDGSASFEACIEIHAHDAFSVTSTGEVSFTADRIVLGNGFSVAVGGEFVAIVHE